jgi:uncharacterized damage-inducible protein DinB
MECQADAALEILSRTPATLHALLHHLSVPWTRLNVGAETWSAYDVVGHLIHGEKTDWIPRARIILHAGESQPFESFDRFAQFQESQGQSLEDLLEKFAHLRRKNLKALQQMNITPEQWEWRGTHPELGTVTLRQLLATWVVHDLSHIGQIVEVMAKQYAIEVGPWKAYLPILDC